MDRLSAHKAFLESVRKNGEQDTYRAILMAGADLALAQASGMDHQALAQALSPARARTEAQAASELSELEKKRQEASPKPLASSTSRCSFWTPSR